MAVAAAAAAAVVVAVAVAAAAAAAQAVVGAATMVTATPRASSRTAMQLFPTTFSGTKPPPSSPPATAK